MSRIKVSKRALPFILAATLVVGGIDTGGKTTTEEQAENKYGYTQVNPLINWNVSEEDFVILDVGDHNDKGVSFQNSKIKYCNKKDISLGIIVSTDSKKEENIPLLMQDVSNGEPYQFNLEK